MSVLMDTLQLALEQPRVHPMPATEPAPQPQQPGTGHQQQHGKLRRQESIRGVCKSRMRGLTWDSKYKRWRVRVSYHGKQLHVGRYNDELEAARAYDVIARQLFGKDALTNFTPSGDPTPAARWALRAASPPESRASPPLSRTPSPDATGANSLQQLLSAALQAQPATPAPLSPASALGGSPLPAVTPSTSTSPGDPRARMHGSASSHERDGRRLQDACARSAWPGCTSCWQLPRPPPGERVVASGGRVSAAAAAATAAAAMAPAAAAATAAAAAAPAAAHRPLPGWPRGHQLPHQLRGAASATLPTHGAGPAAVQVAALEAALRAAHRQPLPSPAALAQQQTLIRLQAADLVAAHGSALHAGQTALAMQTDIDSQTMPAGELLMLLLMLEGGAACRLFTDVLRLLTARRRC